jgi:hypothetical protein
LCFIALYLSLSLSHHPHLTRPLLEQIVDEKTLIKQYRAVINDLRLELAEYQSGEGTVSSSALLKAQEENIELERQVKDLEHLLQQQSGQLPSTSPVPFSGEPVGASPELVKAQAANAALQDALNESRRKIKHVTAEYNKSEAERAALQAEVENIHNLEEMKSAFDDYQTEIQSQIDQDRVKV